MKQKGDNKLIVTSKENKYSQILKRLELTPFPSEQDNIAYLTTENFFMLQNLKTQGFLVGDTDDKNPNFDLAYSVTTNPLMNFACPRSLFQIEKYNTFSDKYIRFGEQIVFSSHNLLTKEKLYLFSQLISHQSFSRFSRNQEVLLNSVKNYSTCWVIEHIDPTMRFSMEGKLVPVNEPFIIKHCSTGRLLASDLIDYNNDYGREYEVCCFNFMSSNKYQALISEKVGTLKVDTKMKVELEQNIWRVVDNLN